MFSLNSVGLQAGTECIKSRPQAFHVPCASFVRLRWIECSYGIPSAAATRTRKGILVRLPTLDDELPTNGIAKGIGESNAKLQSALFVQECAALASLTPSGISSRHRHEETTGEVAWKRKGEGRKAQNSTYLEERGGEGRKEQQGGWDSFHYHISNRFLIKMLYLGVHALWDGARSFVHSFFPLTFYIFTSSSPEKG